MPLPLIGLPPEIINQIGHLSAAAFSGLTEPGFHYYRQLLRFCLAHPALATNDLSERVHKYWLAASKRDPTTYVILPINYYHGVGVFAELSM
jgi:hypothetical protein